MSLQVLTLNQAIRKGRAFGHDRPRREIINPICAAKPRADSRTGKRPFHTARGGNITQALRRTCRVTIIAQLRK